MNHVGCDRPWTLTTPVDGGSTFLILFHAIHSENSENIPWNSPIYSYPPLPRS